MSNILDEAIEDAKLLKETAIENAKNVLIEALSPDIKKLVEQELGESESQLEATNVAEGEVSEEVTEDVQQEDLAEELEENNMEETVEITKEDLQQAFAEVMDHEIRENILPSPSVEAGFDDVDNPNKKASGDTAAAGETGIADDKEGEHHWKDEVPSPAKVDWTVKEAKLRRAFGKQVAGLKEELKLYKEATAYLKRNLQEVNLFNSRLIYARKLIDEHALNKRQTLGIVEQFDGAASIREVELIYKSLRESFKIAGATLNEGASKRARGSRPAPRSGTSKILGEQVRAESGVEDFTSRMQRLAGILE